MADEARKLLDSLMGTHRNTNKEEVAKKKGTNFLEDNVCKLYLVGFCPQFEELFHSTKRDIGICPKVHSMALKEEFEAHPDKAKYSDEYLGQLKQYLAELVRNADEWVARERRNIEAANAHIQESGPNEVARAEIANLHEQVKTLQREADSIAELGQVEEARLRMAQAAELKEKAETWHGRATALRAEDICEVCGSRMESGEAQRARERHKENKIHMGYVLLRNWLDDVRERLKKREDSSHDRRDKSKEKDRGGGRSRSRDRRRSKDADARFSEAKIKATQEKDGTRGRQRSRSRDRDRERRRGGRDDRGRDHGHDRDRRRHH